tara:strand:+ start:33921 stop:35636 length:1716 start_codon:yes stop_codon:yes gene_type:complete
MLISTLREAPGDADLISHQLSLRAGLIRPLASGIFSYLPLGLRVVQKIEAILREEMVAIGCVELSMPVVHPAELWKRSGRWEGIGPELLRMEDRTGREICLAMTHEEAVADLARYALQSYKELPVSVFQIQTKFRDEPRSRGGLIRVREFTMKDAYSFDLDNEGLDESYNKMFRAYERVFHRSGFAESVISVQSDTGIMGGSGAHEFMYLNSAGEDTLIICDQCNYSANREAAVFRRECPDRVEALPLEEVNTPDCKTIKELTTFLNIPSSSTAKAVFFVGTINGVEQMIFAVIRGDYELNETKLSNAVKAKELRPATEQEIRNSGSEPGYGSPIGLDKEVVVVVDPIVAETRNLVSGANKADHHFLNVNVGRDYEADLVTDLVAVEEGMPCVACGSPLCRTRGIEVGNIFKLGTKYSEGLEAAVLDESGRSRPLVMGSYGIGVGRLMACVIEEHHDEHGIIWPMELAPFQVHMVVISNKELEIADKLYQDLESGGFEVLLDDRRERAGVKFNDADLIGIPIRVTLAPRGLEKGQVEVKLRGEEKKMDISIDRLVDHVGSLVESCLDRVLA